MFYVLGIKQERLNNIAELKRGTTITKESSIIGNYPVISGGKLPAYHIDHFNRDGDIITIAGSGAGAGYVQYWTSPIFVCDAFTIKGNANVKTKYLYYCLSNLQKKIYSTKKGSGVPHVHISDIENFSISIPPLFIQDKIVEILDKLEELSCKEQEGLKLNIKQQQKKYEFYRDILLKFKEKKKEK